WLQLRDSRAHLVDDFGRHLVHPVLVACMDRDLLEDLLFRLALERGRAARDEVATAEFLHGAPPSRSLVLRLSEPGPPRRQPRLAHSIIPADRKARNVLRS